MSAIAVLALTCLVLGFAVGMAGAGLILRGQAEARAALVRLADPIADNPVMATFRARDVTLAHHRIDTESRELRRLLGAQADQRLPVGLIIAGLVFGLAGGLLTLPW